jgi:hypothetical protein
MNSVTANLEGGFKQLANNLSWLMNEAIEIDAAYFATNASTVVSALSTSTDGASLDTKLTKAQYQNGIGLIEQFKNFFGNSAVTTGDYRNNVDNLIYGAAASPAKLSDAAESLANRLVVLANSAMTQFLMAQDLLGTYYNSSLSVVIGGCPGAMIMYGANCTVTQFTQGITLVEQFKKMINNEAVATSAYSANVAIWRSL